MSISGSYNSSALEQDRVPWQFRAQPAMVSTVASIVVGLLAIGLLIVGRRLSGAFSADLPAGAMLLLALVTASVLTYTRIAWRRNFPLETPEELSFADQLLGWGSSLALALLAIGCCYPANRTADWLIWLPILVADQLWRQNFFDAEELGSSVVEDLQEESRPRLALADTPQHDAIVQQLYRLRDEQGQEVIYGTVRADFVAEQRTAIVHVGFCPPLAYLPEIEAEALPGGAAAKIKVAQSLAHGARLDVRLSTFPTTDCQVWIDLAATPAAMKAQVKSA